ncbi:hypothetical protein M432DRAFT_626055 [Thermoascus aurantiacus ATCC 26904]
MLLLTLLYVSTEFFLTSVHSLSHTVVTSVLKSRSASSAKSQHSVVYSRRKFLCPVLVQIVCFCFSSAFLSKNPSILQLC